MVDSGWWWEKVDKATPCEREVNEWRLFRRRGTSGWTEHSPEKQGPTPMNGEYQKRSQPTGQIIKRIFTWKGGEVGEWESEKEEDYSRPGREIGQGFGPLLHPPLRRCQPAQTTV